MKHAAWSPTDLPLTEPLPVRTGRGGFDIAASPEPSMGIEDPIHDVPEGG
jgi:hypothetical protein